MAWAHCGRNLSKCKWICNRTYCKGSSAIRSGSFFENSLLKLWQIMLLSIFWAFSAGCGGGCTYDVIMKETGVKSKRTLVDWFAFFRDIAVECFALHPRRIGGPGLIVEIDESLFVRRKYHRGRTVANQWVFGGFCRTSKKGFLVAVPDRTSDTLLPLIKQYIRPGSIIFSDMWAAYNYIHQAVNHKRNFVDPVTGVHTNGAEGMWSNAKRKMKSMNGMNYQ
ncbi:hypothetical protein Ahia01_001298500 [Argonauta hians]